jgi:anti-sigma regulatory factor (Ser/Thr protein kinase)
MTSGGPTLVASSLSRGRKQMFERQVPDRNRCLGATVRHVTGNLTGVRAFSVELDVAGGPAAARHARRLVDRELTGKVPERLMSDVTLLVTELVINGVRHGGAGPGSALHVLFEGRSHGLHVEVANPDDGRTRVAPRRPSLDGGGGLGLQIVARVASRWGVLSSDATVVWFDLDCQ